MQSAVVLLLRLLAWKRVQRVVAGDEALQFLLLAGRPASGKAHLMSVLAGGGWALGLGAGGWGWGLGRQLVHHGAQ
jgi:hypothetical protein